MKFIGSWSSRYIGFTFRGKAYYVFWCDEGLRTWGYSEDWHDGPIHTFGLWWIGFQSLHEREVS